MLRLTLWVFFLILSVWAGVYLANHPGYIYIIYQPWTVQAPIWFALLSLLLAFGIFYFLIHTLDRMQHYWYRFKNWLHWRRDQQSYTQTQQGLAALIEQQWSRAEKLLLKGVQQTLDPIINYLGAAYAAQEQDAITRRDQHLKTAHQIAPKSAIAIGIVHAELAIADNQYEQALQILTKLQQLNPYHARVLSLLKKVYIHFGNFAQLKILLPRFKKTKVLSNEHFKTFEKTVYIEYLKTAANQDFYTLNELWRELPRYLKKDPDILYAYLETALSQPALDKKQFNIHAKKMVQNQLRYTWHEGLVRIYSQLQFDNPNQQLVMLGAWVKTHGNRPLLMLTLAKLCADLKLWGRAKEYFEKCLEADVTPAGLVAYGQLLEQLGETDMALTMYRAGLSKLSEGSKA